MHSNLVSVRFLLANSDIQFKVTIPIAWRILAHIFLGLQESNFILLHTLDLLSITFCRLPAGLLSILVPFLSHTSLTTCLIPLILLSLFSLLVIVGHFVLAVFGNNDHISLHLVILFTTLLLWFDVLFGTGGEESHLRSWVIQVLCLFLHLSNIIYLLLPFGSPIIFNYIVDSSQRVGHVPKRLATHLDNKVTVLHNYSTNHVLLLASLLYFIYMSHSFICIRNLLNIFYL